MKIGKWLEEEGLTLLRNWARSGLSDPEIARRMGVGPGTLNRWRRRYPAVAQALDARQTAADDQVEDALLRKALGYESQECRVEITAKGERKGGQHRETGGARLVRHRPVAEKTAAGAVGRRRGRRGAGKQPAGRPGRPDGRGGGHRWNIRASARGRS